MLSYRLIVAFILIPLVIAILFWFPLFSFVITIIMICMLAAWEWSQLAGMVKRSQRVYLSALCGLLLSGMFFIMKFDERHFYPLRILLWISLIWWVIAFILVFFYPISASLWSNSRYLRLLFGILTLFPFFAEMIELRCYHYSTNHLTGSWYLLFVILLAWSTDSGAYIFGKLFGKNKLIPKVSPEKTWEGLVGGLFCSIIVAWLFSMLAPIEMKPFMQIVSAISIACFSVIGDLTESMLKREASIKNSSNLIPGHGGILDCIDSLTAAIPLFGFLLLIFRLF
ncbi:hypothetical protein HHS_04440 [Candidatus Pantoea carbekii]|uniref:Phosphatidate cytidylyltransferase n=1 Tax=Candidatus Pantoea carbekii TaxID=1235990 RepID=U3U7W7_9GAMM|nr:hypothetical protein HHS_04440 [Candidatus Pantoea carbekii]